MTSNHPTKQLARGRAAALRLPYAAALADVRALTHPRVAGLGAAEIITYGGSRAAGTVASVANLAEVIGGGGAVAPQMVAERGLLEPLSLPALRSYLPLLDVLSNRWVLTLGAEARATLTLDGGAVEVHTQATGRDDDDAARSQPGLDNYPLASCMFVSARGAAFDALAEPPEPAGGQWLDYEGGGGRMLLVHRFGTPDVALSAALMMRWIEVTFR